MSNILWRPDTCSCEITYAVDGKLPADQQVQTVVAITPCLFHAGLSPQEGFETVLSESRAKQKVRSAVIEFVPEITKIVPEAGGDARDFKEDKEPTFTFTESRILTVEVPDIDTTRVQVLQTKVDTIEYAQDIVVEQK